MQVIQTRTPILILVTGEKKMEAKCSRQYIVSVDMEK